MTHWADDPRSQKRYRWTRPDGSLDVLAMCAALDADYNARFRTGKLRERVDAGEHARETGRAQEMSVPGAASTAPAPDEDDGGPRHDRS